MKWTHLIFPQAVALLCGCWISPRNTCEDVFLQNKPSFYKTGPWYTLTFANSYTPHVTRNTFNDYNHQSYKKGKTKNSSCYTLTLCMASSCQHQCFEKQNIIDNASDINKIRRRDLVKAPRNIGRSLGSVPNG